MIDDAEDIHLNRRELGEEEDLDYAIDQENEFQEKELRTKILFSIQGLGAVRTIEKQGKRIDAYIKGDYCQESMKDLVKHIRKDLPANPKVKLILSQFNIVESDLIKLLVLHGEDKKLSFWLLALFSYLTNRPSDDLLESEKISLNNALKEYKKTFMRNEGITYLILHISDIVRLSNEERKKAHLKMVEFIITLIRNFLQFRVPDVQQDELHSHFLVAILKEDLMGALLYLLQNEKGRILNQLQLLMLEIFFHIFTCFNPQHLYELKKPIKFKEEAMKMASKKSQPVRHSRFLPNFLDKNQSGVKKIYHTLDKRQEINLQGQRKVPNRMSQLKKVSQIENEYVEQSFLELIIQSNDETKGRSTVREMIFYYAKEFVEVDFQYLSGQIFDQLFKQTPRVTKENVIQYLILCSWQLKMTRNKYQKAKRMAQTPQEQGTVQFDFNQILSIMQTGHFEMIYKILYREVTKEKKKNFDINLFHGALILFLEYVQVIEDISVSFNINERKNANALMANMFRHDIARIFKIGFHRITHEKILITLIKLNFKFFKLLSVYSKGKVLTIQTNRLLKGKKSKKQQENMDNFISQDSYDEENGSEDYNDREEKEAKKQKKMTYEEIEQSLKFQQRKYNEMTEFAIVADYDIISKHLIFLKHGRFKENESSLNKAIFFYFERIVNLLKGQWLFFQAETLTIFGQILNTPEFGRQYKQGRDAIKAICSSFIRLLRKNRLAIVQSLFKYSSLKLKEDIFKNYDDEGEEYPDKGGDNMFID